MNNEKVITFIKNFSFTFSANLLSMIVSVITILFVPKLLGVSEYGYWQLYLLYASYTGIIQLGWCDGIYLRYGGEEYNNLNKGTIGSQFWMVSFFYISISSVILILLNTSANSLINIDILGITLLAGLITTPRGLLYYILQATNNIKQFAKLTMLDRAMFFLSFSILLLIGERKFEVLIFADILGKITSLVVAIYICRDIVFSKINSLKESWIEALKNIDAGFKLMIANIAGMLIIGNVRLNIENNWGIETFSKISLTMSISNLFMVFINAVGMIMFPTLRRTSKDKLPILYKMLRTLLLVLLLATLLLYQPAKVVLSIWLPQYKDGLEFMALLFPIIIFESKMALLINTYLKTLRMEKQLLIVNIITVVLSFFTTYLTIRIFNNLLLAVISIVFLLAFRCIFAEIIVSKPLKINVYKDILFEIILTMVFIYSSWVIQGWLSSIIYCIVYLIYLFFKRNDIYKSIRLLKNYTSNDA